MPPMPLYSMDNRFYIYSEYCTCEERNGLKCIGKTIDISIRSTLESGIVFGDVEVFRYPI